MGTYGIVIDANGRWIEGLGPIQAITEDLNSLQPELYAILTIVKFIECICKMFSDAWMEESLIRIGVNIDEAIKRCQCESEESPNKYLRNELDVKSEIIGMVRRLSIKVI